jgi:cell division initiation protein
MPLTPLDIQNKEFRRAFRGYHDEQVDEFLDQVIKDYTELMNENTILREQTEGLKSQLRQYQQLEETLNKTLIVAQQTAEEVKNNARKEAEVILQEARLQAERLVEAGQAKARKIVADHEELLTTSNLFRSRLRSLVKAQLELLEHETGETETDIDTRSA